jgi:hypothetical protein
VDFGMAESVIDDPRPHKTILLQRNHTRQP